MSPCFFDLSARTKLRVTGSDRIRFVNGQITSDVPKGDARAAKEACVLNAKGHLEAHLFLFAAAEEIWIDANEELRERLQARLERYVIADDVSIEDVTGEFALFHLLAERPPEIQEAKFLLSSRRLLDQGWDVWTTDADAVKEALSAQAEFFDEAAREVFRIENGIGRWGRELTPDIIPPEANLVERAVDYEKGCYIGQEVISRMKMSGQMRQRLCGVIANEELAAGMELRASDKPVGRITSAASSERVGTHIGLGIIKRPFNDADTELIATGGAHAIHVRVATLPFAS